MKKQGSPKPKGETKRAKGEPVQPVNGGIPVFNGSADINKRMMQSEKNSKVDLKDSSSCGEMTTAQTMKYYGLVYPKE